MKSVIIKRNVPKTIRLMLLLRPGFWTISPPQFPHNRQQQKTRPTMGNTRANKTPIANTIKKGSSQPFRNCQVMKKQNVSLTFKKNDEIVKGLP